MEQSLKLPRIAKKVFYRYLLRFYKSMDMLVTVNPYFIDRLEANGVPREKVVYIPNFVSQKEFYPVPADEKNALRLKYKISPEKFVIVCAGQLQTRKGIFDFLEIANRLPDVQFVWAGGFSFGKITDGYEAIQRVVENPPQNVLFTGIVDREKMNEIYNIGDLMFLDVYKRQQLEEVTNDIKDILRECDPLLTSVQDLTGSVRNTLKGCRTSLNGGTSQSLKGLNGLLGNAASGLDQLDKLQKNKDVISDTIQNEWDKLDDDLGLLDIDTLSLIHI